MSEKDRTTRALRALTLGLGAVTLVLFLYVVVARFRYPIDAEWMVGAVRDGVARLRSGEPLYAAPQERFIPFVYPPLYHWTCAFFARFVSVFLACKLVSLIATTITAWGIYAITQRLGASRFWSIASVLLHFGSYSLTLRFYDLERVDAFATAVVVVGLVVLLSGESVVRTAIGGAVLGLAFFAKQPHLLAFVAAVFALYFAGEKRRALVCGGAGIATLALLLLYLEGTTGPWFRFYCVKVPGAHGIEPRVVSVFFITDLPKAFVLSAASIAMAARAFRRPKANEMLVAAIVATTMVEAFFLRAHRGGWSNVILAWTPFGCAAVGIVASDFEERARTTPLARAVSRLLPAGTSLAFLGGIFDPFDASPNADDLAERQRVVALVRKLETEGEVVVMTTGDLTRPTHFQMAALHDLLRAGEPLPEDIARSLRERKYTAILVNDPMELLCKTKPCVDAFTTFATSYFVGARREEREHTGMTGLDARPRFIMRPRKEPLSSAMSPEELARRLTTEMGLAEARAKALPPNADPVIDDTIEQLASR